MGSQQMLVFIKHLTGARWSNCLNPCLPVVPEEEKFYLLEELVVCDFVLLLCLFPSDIVFQFASFLFFYNATRNRYSLMKTNNLYNWT